LLLGLSTNSQVHVSQLHSLLRMGLLLHLGRLPLRLRLSLPCNSHLLLGFSTNSQVHVSQLNSLLHLGLLLHLGRLPLRLHLSSHLHLGLPCNSHQKEVSLLM
jgi:hypothetical protein